MKIQIKRVYEAPEPTDGYRILIDRLWPRGLTKDSAAVDEWVRDASPSTELRRWFGHEPERWAEFKRRYLDELHHEPAAAALERLRKAAARQRVTLLYGAKDEAHNNAVVLLELLREH
ncbi:MAG TPA: DUF488 domain-containing protein [Gallionella sp.]|nr:DUF488 domain-containing protein [Gallionella sp.]